MASPEQHLEEIQKRLFLSAILDTLRLEEPYASDDFKYKESSKILSQAEERLAAKDFQDLLNGLSGSIKPSANRASSFLVKDIYQIKRRGDTAPVSESHAAVQPASAAAQQALQALQTLQASSMTESEFVQAIFTTVLLDLNAAEQKEYGPGMILDMAAQKFVEDPIQFDNLLQSLIDQLSSQELDTEIAVDLLAKTCAMQNDLEPLVEAARCSLDPSADSGDASAGISGVGVADEARAVQKFICTDDELQAKKDAKSRMEEFAERSSPSLEDFRGAIRDTFIVLDEDCCTTAEVILSKAWATYAQKSKLLPLFNDVTTHLEQRQFAAEPFQVLRKKARDMWHDAVASYESDDDTASLSTGPELPHISDAPEVHCTPIIFNGRKTRLFLTTQAPAPVIVTLLNGLALSDEGHRLLNVDADTLSMEDMLNLVAQACQMRFTDIGELPDAEDYVKHWKLLAKCLGLSWEDKEKDTTGDIFEELLFKMRLDLLEKYFDLPTMPNGEEPLSMCRHLFDALQVVFEGPGTVTDPGLPSSPQGPGKMGHGASKPTAELKDVQLVGKGSQGQGLEDMVQRTEEGVLGGPAFPAVPDMHKRDVDTYEAQKKAHCGPNVVKTFIYAAEGQGICTFNVMAAVGDELFVLEQTEGGSHGHGPVPRWFRLAVGIIYAPEDPKCYQLI